MSIPPFQEPRIILSCIPSLAAPPSTLLLVVGEYVQSSGGCREGPGLCGSQVQWDHIFPFLFLETAPYKITQHGHCCLDDGATSGPQLAPQQTGAHCAEAAVGTGQSRYTPRPRRPPGRCLHPSGTVTAPPRKAAGRTTGNRALYRQPWRTATPQDRSPWPTPSLPVFPSRPCVWQGPRLSYLCIPSD